MALGSLLAACAGADAPVCQPALSWATPAYSCGAGQPVAPLVVAPDPAPVPVEPPAPEPPQVPVLVALRHDRIELLEKVQFEVGAAVLLPASERLLDQVAVVLFDHPEILKLRIEGHTDSQGSNASNQKLSQQRAEAVRAYLEKAGVEPPRLLAKGFGETKPIADNRTPEGREQNRRVELVIAERR
jgi:OOP family OmpA-OmpF porin